VSLEAKQAPRSLAWTCVAPRPLITLLDGPLGTELAARGVPTPLPEWSAAALRSSPEIVAAIHRDYAAAGATVHVANTFRTRRRTCPLDWELLARRAVALARSAVPAAQVVAGSLAPLEDCYRPDLSPADPEPEHRELAEVLVDAGCDLLLVETMPHGGEALAALAAARATGVPVWVAFTGGPEGKLMAPAAMGALARQAVAAGAAAVLVNCVAADRTLPFVEAMRGCGVPVGAYANAGAPDAAMGWRPLALAADRYLELAAGWVAAGASILGGCCGTGIPHVKALADRYRS